TKNPDDRFQTAEDFAKALRAAKDPSWTGQMDEVTSLLQTAAPTAPARSAASASTLQTPAAPTAPIPVSAPAAVQPATRPSRGNRGLWLGLAGLLLVGAGVTGWWLLRQAPAPAGSTEGPATDSANPNAQAPRAAGANPAGSAVKSSLQTAPSGSVPTPTEPLAQEAKSPGPGPAEPRAIDQPERYEPEKLDKLQPHERLNLGNVSMSEAIQLADSQPDKAIHGFRQAIKADPYNVNAHAWLATVLHDQGRTGEFIQELREARRLGILGQMATRNIRFRAALKQARFNRKLPPDLAD
ncbi:MAG TPA: hypothetical protein VFV26_03815, partial [Geothrix sp.]|nr:hypothetical protein [Geothrix sp.]